MTSYQFFQGGVRLFLENGRHFDVYFNEYSGTAYYRYKIDTITSIKHPGIYLGVGQDGQNYYMHNHISYGRAVIDSEEGFTKGQQLYVYSDWCTNAPLTVIQRGLNFVLTRKPYSLSTYNCQTFTNSACHNQARSEDADKWKAIFGLAAMFTGIAILANAK